MLKKIHFITISLIAFLIQYGCEFGAQPKASAKVKEFEGVITYHEIQTNSDGEFNADDTVQVYYSHGNYVGMHSNKSNKFHLVKDYYFKDGPLRLYLFNDSDTLHQISLNSSIEKLESFKITPFKERVLSRDCELITLNTSYNQDGIKTYTDFSFVFSKGYLNIDKNHFKKWRLGFCNKVMEESGSFYLKFKAVYYDNSHNNILSSKTLDVISVKEQPVDPGLFKIDESKIAKAN